MMDPASNAFAEASRAPTASPCTFWEAGPCEFMPDRESISLSEVDGLFDESEQDGIPSSTPMIS